MLKFLADWLKQETTLVERERANNKKTVRPSSIILGLFVLFYLLSPIDVIPEALVKPSGFGYIDDVLILLCVTFYVYKDVRGLISDDKVRSIRIPQQKKPNTESNLPVPERLQGKDIAILNDSGSSSSGDVCQSIDSHNSTPSSNSVCDSKSCGDSVQFSDSDKTDDAGKSETTGSSSIGEGDILSNGEEAELSDADIDPLLAGLLSGLEEE